MVAEGNDFSNQQDMIALFKGYEYRNIVYDNPAWFRTIAKYNRPDLRLLTAQLGVLNKPTIKLLEHQERSYEIFHSFSHDGILY